MIAVSLRSGLSNSTKRSSPIHTCTRPSAKPSSALETDAASAAPARPPVRTTCASRRSAQAVRTPRATVDAARAMPSSGDATVRMSMPAVCPRGGAPGTTGRFPGFPNNALNFRRCAFGHCAALAQSAERLTRNEKVWGSIPQGGSLAAGLGPAALLCLGARGGPRPSMQPRRVSRRSATAERPDAVQRRPRTSSTPTPAIAMPISPTSEITSPNIR